MNINAPLHRSSLLPTGLRRLAALAVLASIPPLQAQVSFVDSGQQLNNADGNDVVHGDLNRDGFIDAVVANGGDSRIYFGDGRGQFTDSGQRFGGAGSAAVADVDGDGDLDIVVGSAVWLNDGQGRFTVSNGAIDSSEGGGLLCRLADLNGDGRPDIFAVRNYDAMRVYLNDGTGRFRDSGQRLGDGTIGTGEVAWAVLGDIDGNGTIDAVTCGWRYTSDQPCANRVWLNDGQGSFHESGQLLDEGLSHVHGLAMGDLNGDGRPDLVMGLQDFNRSGRVYLNDGTGRFVGGANLGGTRGEALTLADFDGNGTLDVFAGNSAPPNRIWLNDGAGVMSDSGLRLGATTVWCWGAAAGDFSGDGKPDVFVVNSQLANTAQGALAQVWLNTTPFPPRVRTQPVNEATAVGGSATFGVVASGDTPLTYRWQRQAAGGAVWADLSEGGAFAGTATAALTVQAGAVAQSGDQFRCVVTNGVTPDATSQPATLTVAKGPAAVAIAGTSFTYDGTPKSVTVSTAPIGLATTVTYAGAAAPPSAAGNYTVVATVDDANYAGSGSATLAIAPVVMLAQSGTVAGTVCGTASFGASATTGGAQATWQWQVQHAGGAWTDLAGATAETLTLPSVQAFHAGSYRVVATTDGASAASGAVALSVAPTATSPAARLLNLSTRALCLTGDDVLIPGFVIAGTGTKRLLIRAVGPELVPFGIPAPLPDPGMVLKRLVGGSYVDHASNDDWGANANAADIVAAAASVFAFDLAAGSRSSALLLDLPPGQYTVVASDTGTGTGIGIVELYDIDAAASGTRLTNISNRGFVGTGNELMIPGFVVSEEGPKTFLIRAVGPTLGDYQVSGVLADPHLAIHRRLVGGGDEQILTNDNWGENGDAAATAAVAAQIYAFALRASSRDAAFVVTLTPGIYTVHATGVGTTTGVALVEVYVVE
jgi:hypothetical protein